MFYLLFVISKNIFNSFLAQISRKLQYLKKRRFYRRKRRVAGLELSTMINFSKSAFKSNTSFIHHMLYEKCNCEKFFKIMFF